MKKRIYWSLCGVSILMALLTAALSVWSFYQLLLERARDELTVEYRIIEKAYEDLGGGGDEKLVEMLDRQFFETRLTLVGRDGRVLYDTAGAGGMENHGARPEIAGAFAYGSGEAVRQSETQGEATYYYAGRLDDGHVLRISKQTSSVGAVLAGVIPGMLGVCAVILAGCVFLSGRLARRIVAPLNNLDLERADRVGGYDEFDPFLQKIREQNRLIREQMDGLREEQDMIKTIASNMREGLILLDGERRVLSLNQAALGLLDAPEGDYAGRSVLTVCRVQELQECVRQALEGRAREAVLSFEGWYCQAFVNPVFNGGEVCGAIILLLDVTERVQAERMRRNFSANVSHELKTPLTSISGFAELMESGMAAEPGDIKRFAGRIYREASRLIALTDDIIRLSRIEEGGAMERGPVELKGLCGEIQERLRFAAEQKGVTLSLGGEATEIFADRRMMEELAENLMDNGVKYNQPGGEVMVTVRKEGGAAVLKVEDTGIGIPKEHQERIFERFYRVDKSRSKETGGTGLGLSIVKHIVERHGGTIRLQSVPGQGTRVTVTFPLSSGTET